MSNKQAELAKIVKEAKEALAELRQALAEIDAKRRKLINDAVKKARHQQDFKKAEQIRKKIKS